METKLKKFKEMYKKEITPRTKKKDKIKSERNKIYSEIDNLDSERAKLYSEIDKLYSERNKLYSERNSLYSEINKLYSERDKLNSEIIMCFYTFGKENDCVVEWENYGFKLSELKLKAYNKDKTGFEFIDMKGKQREELFEKEIEQKIEHEGNIYVLKKWRRT